MLSLTMFKLYPSYCAHIIVRNDVASNHVVPNESSDVIELSDSNGNKESNEDDDDDDDLFCDSLGPELMEEQVVQYNVILLCLR